jgi:hypothetical protein
MRENRFYSLYFLLCAAVFGGACGAIRHRESTASGELSEAGIEAQDNPGSASSRDYLAPDRAFVIKIPGDWKLERDEKDGAFMTSIRPAGEHAANLSIMTINGALTKPDSAGLKSHMLVETSKPFFQGWMNGLKEQARVEGTGQIYPTRFADFDALRMDVTYYRDDPDDPRRGYCVFLLGDKTTFFISLTGSKSRFKELEKIISTIRLEP